MLLKADPGTVNTASLPPGLNPKQPTPAPTGPPPPPAGVKTAATPTSATAPAKPSAAETTVEADWAKKQEDEQQPTPALEAIAAAIAHASGNKYTTRQVIALLSPGPTQGPSGTSRYATRTWPLSARPGRNADPVPLTTSSATPVNGFPRSLGPRRKPVAGRTRPKTTIPAPQRTISYGRYSYKVSTPAPHGGHDPLSGIFSTLGKAARGVEQGSNWSAKETTRFENALFSGSLGPDALKRLGPEIAHNPGLVGTLAGLAVASGIELPFLAVVLLEATSIGGGATAGINEFERGQYGAALIDLASVPFSVEGVMSAASAEEARIAAVDAAAEEQSARADEGLSAAQRRRAIKAARAASKVSRRERAAMHEAALAEDRLALLFSLFGTGRDIFENEKRNT